MRHGEHTPGWDVVVGGPEQSLEPWATRWVEISRLGQKATPLGGAADQCVFAFIHLMLGKGGSSIFEKYVGTQEPSKGLLTMKTAESWWEQTEGRSFNQKDAVAGKRWAGMGPRES